MNETGTCFELKDVEQVMDFKSFESALESQGVISSTFWTPWFRNKHIPYKLHNFFIHFYFISIFLVQISQG